jgi:predicted transcriptional regulator
MKLLVRYLSRAALHIEIHDAALEARIRKRIYATGSASAEEALLHFLETQEERDRWLTENRDAINAKIRRGIAQLDRGEGIPEDQLDAYLTEQKAKPE